mmetsp:Transcript_25798/g.85019  ORF Transcript_25798/g.85019 Transcript_25798/m.85019 type:complete len:299 (+) Transcript_25798:777-1673(+)
MQRSMQVGQHDSCLRRRSRRRLLLPSELRGVPLLLRPPHGSYGMHGPCSAQERSVPPQQLRSLCPPGHGGDLRRRRLHRRRERRRVPSSASYGHVRLRQADHCCSLQPDLPPGGPDADEDDEEWEAGEDSIPHCPLLHPRPLLRPLLLHHLLLRPSRRSHHHAQLGGLHGRSAGRHAYPLVGSHHLHYRPSLPSRQCQRSVPPEPPPPRRDHPSSPSRSMEPQDRRGEGEKAAQNFPLPPPHHPRSLREGRRQDPGVQRHVRFCNRLLRSLLALPRGSQHLSQALRGAGGEHSVLELP